MQPEYSPRPATPCSNFSAKDKQIQAEAITEEDDDPAPKTLPTKANGRETSSMQAQQLPTPAQTIQEFPSPLKKLTPSTPLLGQTPISGNFLEQTTEDAIEEEGNAPGPGTSKTPPSPTRVNDGARSNMQAEQLSTPVQTIQNVSSPSMPLTPSVSLFGQTPIGGDLMGQAKGTFEEVWLLREGKQNKRTMVYSKMLQTMKDELTNRGRSGHAQSPGGPEHPLEWSLTQWITHFKATAAEGKKVTLAKVINTIFIHLWREKLEREVEMMACLRKRKHQPRGRAASRILDHMTSGNDNQGGGSESNVSRAKEKDIRSQISTKVSRGKKLIPVIAEGGLGVLLSRNIWEIAKSTEKHNADHVVGPLQKNEQVKMLLRALEPQVQHVMITGKSDVDGFQDELAKILSPEEIEEAMAWPHFAWEKDHVTEDQLKIAVDGLIGWFNEQIQKDLPARNDVPMGSKHKAPHNSHDDDHGKGDYPWVTMGKASFPLRSLLTLLGGNWIDNWLIWTAMSLVDRPGWTEVQDVITLPQDKFTLWGKNIKGKRRHRTARGDSLSIHLCPLSLDGLHFTLLEVNDQNKMIYYYDSMGRNSNMSELKQNLQVHHMTWKCQCGLTFSGPAQSVELQVQAHAQPATGGQFELQASHVLSSETTPVWASRGQLE
ncbi:hypothetical protein J3R30DRAFT_3886177 [Lentinula aciculospora]|uniref:Ubiquitin-like protease family profile domain-containing protein n=1 Tax=Lentinula aciculospora TaxID=153920 RepID=A0A9W8ZTB0_9AGAR|nr:hypothetical protein J3R30DRAFT_3886177 [Lentinula aciculospora]